MYGAGATNGLCSLWNKDLFGSFENKSLRPFLKKEKKRKKTSEIKAAHREMKA